MKKKLIARLMVAMLVTSMIPQTIWANPGELQVEVTKVENHINQEAYTQTRQKAEQIAKLLVDTLGVPGMQYALMENGEIIVSGSYHAPKTAPALESISEDTLYGIGSVSKMYTAVAMMKLVELGEVELDTPVTTYIPEFEMADARYKAITVRMLLNHSSGLMGSSFEDAFLYEDVDTFAHDQLLEVLKGQRLKADPGAFSVYCNDGFMLAETIIERVSGMSFTQFITKHIIEPLELIHTATPENLKNLESVSPTYSMTYPGELPREVANVIGTGGIYSTAEELCKFGQIFTGEKDVLSEKAVEAMGTNEAQKGIWPERSGGSVDYGLGWDSVDLYPFNEYGITAWTKGGDTLNYHTSLIVLPEQNMTVAVTASGGISTYNQMAATEIALSALQENRTIEALNAPPVLIPPVAAQMPQDMQKYAGFYVMTGQMGEVGINEQGVLTLSLVGLEHLPAQTFQYTEDGVFVSLDGSAEVSFVEEENGKVYLHAQGYAMLPGVATIKSAVYQGEKVDASTLTEEEQLAWEARNGKLYYVLNEKYTSAMYQVAMPVAGTMLSEKTPGYMGGYEITGPNDAKAIGEIPGVNGRDMMDIHFYQEDGVEYMILGSSVAISETGIETLAATESSTCTISDTGYARWYNAGEAAGKTMTVTLPDTGSFAVYDANGICVNYTTVSNNPTVVLPEGAKIIFMGDAGTVFKMTLK